MSKIIHRRQWLFAAAIFLGALVGCSALSKPYPQKNLYAISVDASPTPVKAGSHDVLRIEAMHIAKPFDGTTFVYKVGRSQFTTDYYAGFISTPDSLLGGELTSWLARSDLYSSVVFGKSMADCRWSLESNVTALYGDFSASKPTAVLRVKFFLIDNANGHQRIAFQKVYSETEPISGGSPSDLVDGWDKAYGRILSELLKDLILLPATQGA